MSCLAKKKSKIWRCGDGILLNHKKEQNNAIYSNVDEASHFFFLFKPKYPYSNMDETSHFFFSCSNLSIQRRGTISQLSFTQRWGFPNGSWVEVPSFPLAHIIPSRLSQTWLCHAMSPILISQPVWLTCVETPLMSGVKIPWDTSINPWHLTWNIAQKFHIKTVNRTLKEKEKKKRCQGNHCF